MWTCERCGKRNSDNSTCCSNCGIDKTTNRHKKSPKGMPAYVAILLTLVLIFAVTGIWLFNRNKPSSHRDRIVTGFNHTVILNADGTVIAFGDNRNGQCDVSSWRDIIQIDAGAENTVGLRADGTVVATGYGINTSEISELADIVSIAAGDFHVVALNTNGTVISTADEPSVDSWKNITAIAAGTFFTAGLREDGTVVVSGTLDDGYGVPQDVSTWTDIVAISGEADTLVGLRKDGTVEVAGNGILTYDATADWNNITAVSVSSLVIAGLTDKGTIRSDGYLDSLIDGLSEWTDIEEVSVGGSFAIGLKRDGTLVAIGDNDYGQCNIDLVQVTSKSNKPAENGVKIVSADGGRYHTVALRSDGTVVATGREYTWAGISGWNDVIAIAAGESHTLGLKKDGTVVATGQNDYGECNTSRWNDIVSIAAGSNHSVGLKADGTVVACGEHNYGECDVADWRDIVSIAAGDGITLGVKEDGTEIPEFDSLSACHMHEWRNPSRLVYMIRHRLVQIPFSGHRLMQHRQKKALVNASAFFNKIHLKGGFYFTENYVLI